MTPAEEMQALRNQLFGLIIPNTRGLSLDRINRFLRHQGIPMTPWIAVSPSDREHFAQACYATKLIGKNILNPTLDGISLFSLQFSIVFRGTENEIEMGSSYAETTAVHELVHGAGSRPEDLIRLPSGQIIQRRMGLIINGKGHFLAEALAELIQGIYITTVLRQHWYCEEVLASHGLRPLLNKNPRLLVALKNASIGGPLREVEVIIDAIGGQGLYKYLHDLEPGTESTLAGVAAIRESLRHPSRRTFA